MSKRTLIGVSSSVLLVVALLATAKLLFDQDPAPLKLALGPPPPKIAWQAEAEQSYRLSIDSEVMLELPGSLGRQRIAQRVSGILNLRVFDIEADGVRAGFQLRPAMYELGGVRSPQIESGLSAPFIAVFGPLGHIREFEFPAQLGEAERTILSEMLRTFQVILPEHDRAASGRRERAWTVSEAHATGRYLAVYQILDDGRIQKQKSRYSEVDPAFGEARAARRATLSQAQRRLKRLTAEPVRSVAMLRPADGVSWLRSANVEERVIVRSGRDVIADSTMRAELELRDEPPGADLALMKRVSWSEMVARASIDPTPHLSDEEKAARLRERRERLAGLVDELNGDQARSAAVLHGIVQMLVAAPELAFDVGRALEAPELTAAAEPRLIHALARAGTVESQEVLQTITEDGSQPSFNRLRAIVALGGVDDATEATFDTLVHMHQASSGGGTGQLANSALLAIGGIGASMQEHNSQDAGKVSDYLAQNLLASSSDRELEVALKAIGNSRDVGFRDTILSYLQHESPVVRASAAETLGKLRVDGVLGALTQHLAVESDPGVRTSIAAGIYESGQASVESLALVSTQVANESESRARYHMARYLGENLEVYPEGRETLGRLALADGSKRIRNYATAVMLRTRTP